MRKMIGVLILVVAGWQFLFSANRVYSFAGSVAVRGEKKVTAAVIAELHHGRWVEVLETSGEWLKIKLLDGREGFLPQNQVTDRWFRVLKKERRLEVMQDQKATFTFPVALGFNPVGDKVRLKDGCTPLGRFFLGDFQKHPVPASSYGARSVRISYPNIEDARRGLKDRLIDRNQYAAIVRAVHSGQIPPQHTALGGSIRIHGGGTGNDWTLGCVALTDPDVIHLYNLIDEKPLLVEIYRDAEQAKPLNDLKWLQNRIISACDDGLKKGCTYTRAASAVIPMAFPLGDIDSRQGVCTDVVIRVLRAVNIDLQALLYEDILLHPGLYTAIKKANTHIDHRRTRNLKVFFDGHARVLTCEPPKIKPGEWSAGDIVLLDTGISNGTIYDHIGIVSNHRVNGIPQVFNLWATGSVLAEMDLLQGGYPAIVGHYRLTGLLDYDAFLDNY